MREKWSKEPDYFLDVEVPAARAGAERGEPRLEAAPPQHRTFLSLKSAFAADVDHRHRDKRLSVLRAAVTRVKRERSERAGGLVECRL